MGDRRPLAALIITLSGFLGACGHDSPQSPYRNSDTDETYSRVTSSESGGVIDKNTVASAVTGPEGGDFVRYVFTNQWDDDGRTASKMFEFSPEDNSPATSRIISSVGKNLTAAADWAKMLDIPGTNHESVGAVNPALVRTVASSFSPYITRLAGGDNPDPEVFSTDWVNGSNYIETARLTAVMATDSEASRIFRTGIEESIRQIEFDYAGDPAASSASRQLATVGVLRGVLDKSVELHPGNDSSSRKPSSLDVYLELHAILSARQQRYGNLPADVTHGFESDFDTNGSLRSFEDIMRQGRNHGVDLETMLQRLGGDDGSKIREAYRSVVR